ncbi:MAG: MerR family transcriptional regulator [Alphaproteobacteria bacterium]|nr:MerR family transcriptional regulator [Alphaproteobacteria bacterium]
MTTYSIGEVAKRTGLSTYTLRFYEKEGLLPSIRKNSAGLRRFSEPDLRWLEIIECLKSMGMPLKAIKHYLDLYKQGATTVMERKRMILEQKEHLEEQMKALQDNIERINFKIKYYELVDEVGESQVFEEHQELKAEYERLFHLKK